MHLYYFRKKTNSHAELGNGSEESVLFMLMVTNGVIREDIIVKFKVFLGVEVLVLCKIFP